MKKQVFLSIVLSLIAFLSYSQNVSDLVISEIKLAGDSLGIKDEYGKSRGWVEIHNSSFSTVNLSGCFISNDRNNLKKYKIASGDKRFKLSPKHYILFFDTEREKNHSTTHLNFQILAGSTIYLTSNDGKSIIDSLQIPKNLDNKKSISKIAIDKKALTFAVNKDFSLPTPGFKNQTDSLTVKDIAKEDPYGIILSIVAMSVVFLSLILLWLLLSVLFSKQALKITIKIGKKQPVEDEDEVATAISMALEEDNNKDEVLAVLMALEQARLSKKHDKESYVLCIQNTKSVWSEKSQSFRNKKR